jgi:serine/threonine protein kinase
MNVAIKIYHKMKLYDKERRKCVEQEISILNTVEHEGVIKLLDTYETDTKIHLVMECFSTLSLRTFIK